MKDVIEISQFLVMCACIGVLSAIVSFYALRAFGVASKKILAAFGPIMAVILVSCCVYYGGGKTIRWDTGLHDNGSVITNDSVEIRWTYSGIPSSSSVYVDNRLSGTTNEWENLGVVTAADGYYMTMVPNATNYDYWVYSTYVPPVPVHTNGVWVNQAYETKERRGAAAFLIINGRIDSHGKAIAPPSARKKEDYE